MELLCRDGQLQGVHDEPGRVQRLAAHHSGLERPVVGLPVAIQDLLSAECVETLSVCTVRERLRSKEQEREGNMYRGVTCVSPVAVEIKMESSNQGTLTF